MKGKNCLHYVLSKLLKYIEIILCDINQIKEILFIIIMPNGAGVKEFGPIKVLVISSIFEKLLKKRKKKKIEFRQLFTFSSGSA